MSGPGTHLHTLLLQKGFQPRKSCKCQRYRRWMDRKGPQWCEQNIDTISQLVLRSTLWRHIPGARTLLKSLIRKAIEMSTIIDVSTYFADVRCVTLDRRPERWGHFNSHSWPFPIQRYHAIDGTLSVPPYWWRGGPGAWGCYRSHLNLIEQAIQQDTRSILLLEDDAQPIDDFPEQLTNFLRYVPDDWDIIYLGGQHLGVRNFPPRRINDHCYQPFNVNRTHAFAINHKALVTVYRHLCRVWDNRQHHIDHQLGLLHEQGYKDASGPRVYCPGEWLITQAAGTSDICRSDLEERSWPSAATVSVIHPQKHPFYAIIGNHSSGSSALALAVHALGINMGSTLTGYYGGEAVGLTQICNAAIQFPNTKYRLKRNQIWTKLHRWINDRRQFAVSHNLLAGGKYPFLCRMGDQLQSICKEQLRIIHIDRPLEQSIRSLQRRCPDHTADQIEAHVRWIDGGKQDLLSQVHERQIHTLTYDDLLTQPRQCLAAIASWAGISPPEKNMEEAIAIIQPEKRHVA